MGSARELARSAALNAVAAFSKREADRTALTEGQSYEINLRVTGTVDGEKVSIPISGFLNLGFTNPVGSTKRPDVSLLLAIALSRMAKTRRERFLDSIKSADRLPQVDEEHQKIVTSLIGRLATKSPRAGSIKLMAEIPE